MFEDKGSLLCRLCLKSGDCPIDIFDPQGTNGLLVWEIIKEFTEIETCRSDGLPPTICEDCMKKLTDFKYFKKMCIDSRMEFLFHKINDRLVVPVTEDESGPSGGDLRGQSEDHTGGTWNNLEAEGIQSEVLIKMEEVDLSEETENLLPNSIGEYMEDEHSELADVKSQERDAFQKRPPEGDSSIRDALAPMMKCIVQMATMVNLWRVKKWCHVKIEENTEEISSPEEYLSNIGEKVSSEEVRYSDVNGSASEMCMTNERDAFEAPPPEEAASIRDANCSSEEVHHSDVHGGESVMHVKNENGQEILPAEECLSSSGKNCSFEGVQCSDSHVSMSEQVPLSEELMDLDDLHLHPSSDISDQISDAEDHSANITGIETEVTNLSFGDVTRVTVFGGGESVGNREETLEGEKDLKGLKDPERRFSARLGHGAKVPVATRSHLKRRRIRSHCRNENYGPGEDIELTPQGTGGNELGEENGEHTKGKKKTRGDSKYGNGALAGNISIGTSVGDEKSEVQDFICDECRKVFRSKDLIERHLNVPCGSELIDCGNSHKKFQTRKQYKRHRSLHCVSNVSKRREPRGVAVDVSGESEGKSQIEKRNPPACHICNKIFCDNANLNRHIKTVHLKERKFSCNICDKAFGEKGTLQKHMRSHSGLKPHACGHCQKAFTEPGTLRTHIRAVHEMKKPHTCEDCGKAFSHKHVLLKHILLHTGERPHTCDICSRTFSQKVNLQTHMLTHTGEKPHTCTLCSKTFRHNGNLKRHMATHARKDPHP